MTETQSHPIKKILILGLPNTGKSLIFSNLTGKFAVVANSPLTTIRLKKAPLQIQNHAYEVIDTPGLHSLYVHSEEEIQVRNALFSEKPDVIIQCIDANQLKQSLALTAELMTLRVPLVISLNAIDETSRKGIWIDSVTLSQMLGVPVIESIAIQAKGINEIKTAILRARPGKEGISYGDIVERSLAQIESRLPTDVSYGRATAMLMLMNEPYILRELKKADGDAVSEVKAAVEAARKQVKGNINRLIENHRNRWVDQIAGSVIKRQVVELTGMSETIARLSRHPVFGLPILLMLVFIMFFLVVNVANQLAEQMGALFWDPLYNMINQVLPSGFWHDFLIGHYGILSLGLANAFLTVLPILSVYFLMFNILEDTGYIPNLSVLTKRLLEKIGLSGSAILPLVLGFGCKTMATLTTRSLKSDKEKYIAIFLIAFGIPCAAQMGLNMSILGRIGAGAFVIAFGVLFGVEVIAGILLNVILKEDEKDAFIMELPPIRLPSMKWVVKKTYFRIYWFLRESLMVFIYAAVALFIFDRLGLLDALKKVLSPVVEGFLGLPLAMVDAIALCLARHEVASALIISLIKEGQLNYIQCIVAVALTTMLVPCFANIMAMVKELGVRKAVIMIIIINLSAFLAAGILNWVLVALL